MLNFAYRNLKVFFRDKVNVFFSIMAVGITVGIYILFLRDVWLTYGAGQLSNGEEVMDTWLMGGMLSIIPVTSTLGAFSAMVDDRVRKIDKDLVCSPLSNVQITGGYLLAVYLVGVLVSLLGLGLAEIYIVHNGGAALEFTQLLRVLGIILYSTAFSCVAIYFMVSFFHSSGAFLTASVVIGVLIGFLTGCYVPVGLLPEGVQWIVKVFPPSHSASLLRGIFMDKPLDTAFSAEHGFMTREGLNDYLGVTYDFNDHTVTSGESLLLISGAIAVFLLAVTVKTLLGRLKIFRK